MTFLRNSHIGRKAPLGEWAQGQRLGARGWELGAGAGSWGLEPGAGSWSRELELEPGGCSRAALHLLL